MHVILLSILFFLSVSFADDSVVETQYGPVTGVVGTDFRAFRGIPYASPPVGNLRFQPPVPPKSWSTPIETKKWAPSCPQKCDLPKYTCPEITDEDCLYLNVFTPSTDKLVEKQPVMVFIHGGHFDQGGAGTEIYDGPTFVARTGVVLVTVSYRLGALGFLVTKHLGGNWAFMDQLFALQWVQDNIEKFGGDPNQVTIFGESAGATSVRAHLMSPQSKGYFQKAILQSDPMAIPFQGMEHSILYGEHYLKTIKCDTVEDPVACLMDKTTDEMVEAQETGTFLHLDNIIQATMPWAPVVDNVLIHHHTPFEAIRDGYWNGVPILIGADQRDARIFVWEAFNSTLADWKYVVTITALFFPQLEPVLNHYPPVSGIDLRPTLGRVINDYLFTCTARHLIDLSTKLYPDFPVYLYRWNHSLSWDGWGPDYAECVDYPCHGSELVYEFDAPFRQQVVQWKADEIALSRSIMDYWSNFARSQNPNKPQPPALSWPQWFRDSELSLVLQTPNAIVSRLGEVDCDFWDNLGYHFAFNETKR